MGFLEVLPSLLGGLPLGEGADQRQRREADEGHTRLSPRQGHGGSKPPPYGTGFPWVSSKSCRACSAAFPWGKVAAKPTDEGHTRLSPRQGHGGSKPPPYGTGWPRVSPRRGEPTFCRDRPPGRSEISLGRKHVSTWRTWTVAEQARRDAGPYMILYPRVHSNGVIEHV